MNLASTRPLQSIENEPPRRGRKTDRTEWERGQITRFVWALQERETIDAYWSPLQFKCLFRAVIFSRKKQTAVSADSLLIGRYKIGVLNEVFLQDLRIAMKTVPTKKARK